MDPPYQMDLIIKKTLKKILDFKIIKKESVIVLEYAKKKQCYKTILDCNDSVKPFYERIGFKYESNCMRYNHN